MCSYVGLSGNGEAPMCTRDHRVVHWQGGGGRACSWVFIFTFPEGRESPLCLAAWLPGPAGADIHISTSPVVYL